MKFRSALAVSALALGVAVNVAPVAAATVTDHISFSDTGTYPTNGDSIYPYNNLAVASGSFNITFDPTQLYLTQSIAGIITGLTYSVTDPYFGGPLTLDSITSFAFDGAGTLTLYSNPANGKNLAGAPDITIGINGWALGLASDVWYSQAKFPDTLTAGGGVSIVDPTPLPSTWTMLVAGFIGLGFMAYRGTKKGPSAFAVA